MRRILVVVAREYELPERIRIASSVNDLPVQILVTGVGPKETIEKLSAYLEKNEVDLIVNLGFCGSVNKKYPFGTAVVAQQVRFSNPVSLKTQKIDLPDEFSLFRKIKEKRSYRKLGIFQTFSGFIGNRFGVSWNTSVVDQESFHVAVVANKYQVPVIIVKIVSDVVPFIPSTAKRQKAKFNKRKSEAKRSLNLTWAFLCQFFKFECK